MKRDVLQSLNCRSKSSKYDLEIDKTIMEILNDLNINKKSGEVKDQLERLLGRTISPDTYSAHLNNLIKERIVIKDDKGRGKEILYSLSEHGRKLKKLKLLKTDKDRELFRQIYVSLFFYNIIYGDTYSSNDLSQILKDIGATSKDLNIERIEEKGDPNTWHAVSVINKILHFNVVIHYKVIRNVRITETTNYNETIFRDGIKENIGYNYNIPGMSLEDFIGSRIPHFEPGIEDLKTAFELLSDEGLIKPCMEFKRKTTHVLSDDALADLIKDIMMFKDQEDNLIYYQWSYLNRLSKREIERQKQYYSTREFSKVEQVRSQMRTESRDIIKRIGPRYKKEIENEFSRISTTLYDTMLPSLIEKHKTTLKKYAFLSDIFKVVCPFLYQDSV